MTKASHVRTVMRVVSETQPMFPSVSLLEIRSPVKQIKKYSIRTLQNLLIYELPAQFIFFRGNCYSLIQMSTEDQTNPKRLYPYKKKQFNWLS